MLGANGFPVSVVGLGTWQLGADWGQVEEADALAVLDAAAGNGVTFFDTADVYGDGRSETLIGNWLVANPGAGVHVATKMGRRATQELVNYREDNFRQWLDRSRSNLRQDTLELVQLHCPPDEVFASDRVFDVLDQLVDEQVIARYGVSVETTSQALSALERPALTSIQIILNAFRHKPLTEVLPVAQERGVGIIARVPLASGLLSGRYTLETTFAKDDHRNFNRHGEAFDVGETFSGVPYEVGVRAATRFAHLVKELGPEGATPAQVAIAWIIAKGATTVIPGARTPKQAIANAHAADFNISGDLLAAVDNLYAESVQEFVHDRW